MAKGGGGGGSPSAFTGGMPSSVPGGGVTPSSPNVVPSYANFLGGLGGGEMATPDSVMAAFSAAQQQQAQQEAQRAAAAQQMAQRPPQNPMRNMYNQLSGQELLGMKFGRQPENFDPRAARNDSLMRIFAGSMGPRAARGSGR